MLNKCGIVVSSHEMFTPLSYPKTKLQLFRKEEKIYVWDIFRQKKLLLTPEEWVRQHVLHFLVNKKAVPQALIASEYSMEVNALQRRCDAVVFDKLANPVMIVECKAPEVSLTEKVFQQIAQYNFKLQVEWLVCTNGIATIVAQVSQKTGDISYRNEIPDYSEMSKAL